jgi:hypothetical protein
MARAKSVTLQLNTKDQKMESLQSLLKHVGGMLGCEGCGRIAYLHVNGLGDPDPALTKLGAISVNVHE